MGKLKNLLSILFILFFLPSASIWGTGKTLFLNPIEQQHSQWCWAAGCKSILNYKGVTITQCEIVNFAFGRVDCCNDHPWRGEVNRSNNMSGAAGDMENILENWGVNTTYYDRYMPWSSVKYQLDGGNPFIIGYIYPSGGGHIVVGYGYEGSGGIDYICVMDPWPGEGSTWSAYFWTVKSTCNYWGESLKTY